jgi:hypothetical protein
MGTWAEDAFDNDDAADWSWQFDGADEASGLRLIEDALKQAAEAGAARYLEIDVEARAIAAAALVAHLAGQPLRETPYNEDALGWAARVSPHVRPALVGLARQAVARVTGPESELAELWDEAESSWRTSMTELAFNLQGAGQDYS